LSEIDLAAYLARIGLADAPSVDLDGLTTLQQAHLTNVPFENIDVFDRVPVRTDLAWSVDKVVNRLRGGWCFELNGAFSALLTALGFDVALLGAAVLLDGPTALIDHLTLEVRLDRSYLVDVGFGESFIRPLDLNAAGPQDGGAGVFELIPSSQGLTLTRHDALGVPEPQYRFKRMNHQLSDFDEASTRLQEDRTLSWSQKPFATRLVSGGPERITLLSNRFKTVTPTSVDEQPVASADWNRVLRDRFAITRS
jgi:N-hydroxyarylamine O-acetyltransferase